MSEQDGTEKTRPPTRDRGDAIGAGLIWLTKWSLCIIAIAAGAWVLGTVIAALWVVLLPIALALIVATMLWPPTRWLTAHGFRPGAAATVTLLGFIGVLAGVIALIVPSVVDQAPELADNPPRVSTRCVIGCTVRRCAYATSSCKPRWKRSRSG